MVWREGESEPASERERARASERERGDGGVRVGEEGVSSDGGGVQAAGGDWSGRERDGVPGVVLAVQGGRGDQGAGFGEVQQ